ncbi:MAG: hypothetical protein ABIB46_06280 [bacterium]
MTTYKIKFDHIIGGKYTYIAKSKIEARKKMKKLLKNYPYMIMELYKLEKMGNKEVWIRIERWSYSKNFKTGRWNFHLLYIK